MTKKEIKTCINSSIIGKYGGELLDSFIKRLVKLREQNCDEFSRLEVEFYHESYGYDNHCETSLKLNGYRIETDKEYNDRIDRENKIREAQLEREKAQFLLLKQKFEGYKDDNK